MDALAWDYCQSSDTIYRPVGACFYSISFVIVGIVIFIIRSSFFLYNESRYQTTLSWKVFAAFLNQISSGQRFSV